MNGYDMTCYQGIAVGNVGFVMWDSVFIFFLTPICKSLVFRVRRMHPCVLSDVQFEVDLPEDNEIQVHVYAPLHTLDSSVSTKHFTGFGT